jgi:hypothetical protein
MLQVSRRAILAMLAASPLTATAAAGQAPRRPVPLILDTDIGPDVDDAGTVAMLNALADLGEARILAINCCTSSEWGASCISSINAYYSRGNIPIGTYKGTGFLTESKYNEPISRQFPGPLLRGTQAPDAREVYRRVLARQPDGSVTVCAVGPLNNLAGLLDTQGDAHSPLSGLDLVARKVATLSVMGGHYPSGKEWNFEQDPAAAAQVCEQWPTPILFSGFEIGERVKTGRRLLTETPERNPVRAAYLLYVGPNGDRESWDQTALLAAVRDPKGYWNVESGGRVEVDPASGESEWLPVEGGTHAYLVERDDPNAPRGVQRVIEDLMVRPPRRAATP